MTYILAESVFKNTLQCAEENFSGLWLSFYNEILIPANVYSSVSGDFVSLPLTLNEFLSLVIYFMDCEDIHKVCEFFKSNLNAYISEQELDADSCLIKVSNDFYCCEVVA
jgi:hypothetical protein